MTPDFMESPLSQIPPADPTPSAAVAPTGGETMDRLADQVCEWLGESERSNASVRALDAIDLIRSLQSRLQAALSSPVRAEPTLDVQACRQTLGTIRWLASQPLEAGESADGRLLAIVGEVDARLAVPADSTGYDDTIRRAELAGVKRIAGVVRKLLTDEQRATLAAWLDPFAPLHEFVATLQGESPPVRAERGEAERIRAAAENVIAYALDMGDHYDVRSGDFDALAAALTPTPPATPTEPTDA